MATRVVQGFAVISFTVKEDKVKVVLKGEKDEIRAGDGDIADVLESLELHSTAADSSTVTGALRETADSQRSTPYEFSVASFAVTQDGIKVVLEASISTIGLDVLKSLGVHAAAEGEQGVVELTMQRPD